MADRMKRDWRELCAEVTNERDSTKLTSLVQELIEALDRGERSWRSPLQRPDAQNSEAARSGIDKWETVNRNSPLSHREVAGMDRTISTKDLKIKLDKKQITLVETLAPERYREAHIAGALNIPPERVEELAPQLLPNKNAEIVTYCANSH
jgi:hypothetical protein